MPSREDRPESRAGGLRWELRALAGLSLAIILMVSAACVRYREFYSVSFRSKSGTELASGNIMLSNPLPASGTIRAWYKIEMKPTTSTAKEVDMFHQLFKGKESGNVEWVLPDLGGRPAKLDFMPFSADANITASTTQLARGLWKGRWSYVMFTGVYDGGGIDVVKK